MPHSSAALRLVAAALAAKAVVALTAVLYQDLGACVAPAGPTISAYTDVCAPQLGAMASVMTGLPLSFVVKAGATNTTATFIGFIGKRDCTGDPNAFALTLTTATCSKLPEPFGAMGFYAKLSTTDVAVTAASVGGAAYVPIFASWPCVPGVLVADTVISGEASV